MALILVDFRLFPDNHPMPHNFTHGGLGFENIVAAGPALVVKPVPGDKGLEFPDSGLGVRLPAPTSGIYLRAGGFANPVTLTARDASGTVVQNHPILPANTIVTVLVPGPDVMEIDLVGGDNEGIFIELAWSCG